MLPSVSSHLNSCPKLMLLTTLLIPQNVLSIQHCRLAKCAEHAIPSFVSSPQSSCLNLTLVFLLIQLNVLSIRQCQSS